MAWAGHIHRHNSTLRVLILGDFMGGNQIGDAGATALGEALRCVRNHSCLLFFSRIGVRHSLNLFDNAPLSLCLWGGAGPGGVYNFLWGGASVA